MLTRIEIADYQSWKRASIPLGGLTVITGPSNSGKSALIRALLLVARNARGSDYVRRGAPHCGVALIEQAGDVSRAVLIRRGAKSTSGDFYRLRTQTGDAEPVTEKLTKLRGQVPAEVTGALALSDVSFAGQLDQPYLLCETGTEAARRIGELTNVSLVFACAAEAGRRRKGFDRDAKSASSRLDQLRGQAEEFEGLAERRDAAARAEQMCAGVERDAARLQALLSLAARLDLAEAEVSQARAVSVAAAPPDLGQLEAGAAKLAALRRLIASYEDAEKQVAYWAGEAKAAAGKDEAAHRAVHDALAAAGHCPLCGQEVR
jgi:exonuclease SbcC